MASTAEINRTGAGGGLANPFAKPPVIGPDAMGVNNKSSGRKTKINLSVDETKRNRLSRILIPPRQDQGLYKTCLISYSIRDVNKEVLLRRRPEITWCK
jgi:hypothetical protein